MMDVRRLPWLWIAAAIAVLAGVVLACFTTTTLGGVLLSLPTFRTQSGVAAPATGPSPEWPPVIAAQPAVTPGVSAVQIPGLPEDIPVPAGVAPGELIGSAERFSFLTDLSYPDTLWFYQSRLENSEWQTLELGAKIGRSSAELNYVKSGRRLTIRISGVPYVGTLVEIDLNQ